MGCDGEAKDCDGEAKDRALRVVIAQRILTKPRRDQRGAQGCAQSKHAEEHARSQLDGGT